MTDAEMLACATAFTLRHGRRYPAQVSTVMIEVRYSREGSAWAITDGSNSVLNRDGAWEYEPMPSSREDDFLLRCRWPTARDAIDFAEIHLRNYPTGYKED